MPLDVSALLLLLVESKYLPKLSMKMHSSRLSMVVISVMAATDSVCTDLARILKVLGNFLNAYLRLEKLRTYFGKIVMLLSEFSFLKTAR